MNSSIIISQDLSKINFANQPKPVSELDRMWSKQEEVINAAEAAINSIEQKDYTKRYSNFKKGILKYTNFYDKAGPECLGSSPERMADVNKIIMIARKINRAKSEESTCRLQIIGMKIAIGYFAAVSISAIALSIIFCTPVTLLMFGTAASIMICCIDIHNTISKIRQRSLEDINSFKTEYFEYAQKMKG